MSFDRNIPPSIVRTLTSYRLLLALSSAALLIASFPNFNQPWCAWVALVPWLTALRGLKGPRTFWVSYLVGLLFFLGSVWWLIHVTLLGWLVLCAYLALYFGVFGWIVHRIVHSPQSTVHSSSVTVDGRRSTVDVLKLVVIPAAWVALEFLRSHLLSGFGWNLLGYSQTPWLALIQMADVTGVWGVSWLIALVNVAIASFLHAGKLPSRRVAGQCHETARSEGPARSSAPCGAQAGRRPRMFEHGTFAQGLTAANWPTTSRRVPLLIAAGCLIAAGLYGVMTLARPLRGVPVRVAVVQGNIPQEQKWDEAFRDAILERYERLTRAAAAQAPQLIIWPEASVPGILGEDEVVTTRIQRLAQTVSLPLLIGAPMAVPANGVSQLTNSAALLGQDGSVTARYDKLHLVPFGEFVPFESFAPWLRETLPPIGDFVPGNDHTIFTLPVSNSEFRVSSSNPKPETRNPKPSFALLICFEDIFPELARRFVQRGAQWLVTITNDAWFGNTAAPYQHAQASTFRAVELRVPMVRAANTGWSGCIDSRGRWLASVRDPRGEELCIEGVAVCEVTAGDTPTVYRRWGDWFAWLCLLGCLGGLIFAIMKR